MGHRIDEREPGLTTDEAVGSFPAMPEISLFALLANSDDGGGSAIPSLLLFALIPVGMYFLMIRPQRKKQKEAAELQSSLGVGDEVVTTSGIYGFITGEDGARVWLEVDDDVQIRVARAAIARTVDTKAEDQAAETEAAEKDASKGSDVEIDDSGDDR